MYLWREARKNAVPWTTDRSATVDKIAISLKTPIEVGHLALRAKRGRWEVGLRILPLSDTWRLAKAVRKVEFELLEFGSPPQPGPFRSVAVQSISVATLFSNRDSGVSAVSLADAEVPRIRM